MEKSRRLFTSFAGLVLLLVLVSEAGLAAQAGNNNYLDSLNGGIAAILDKNNSSMDNNISAARGLDTTETSAREQEPDEHSSLVMANVKNALNVRSEPNEEAKKVGILYRDCGGRILERRDGWTKLQSGNVIGWCNDDYLLFEEDALAMANDVGKMVAIIDTEALRIRKEPSTEAESFGLLPKGEVTELVEKRDDGWYCIDYEGEDAFLLGEFVKLEFQIDSGETMEEIKARETAEREARRHVRYGEFTTDADTTMLLAALIQCEAGGESYEGQLAVGAVVMNRVRSGAYPNSVHGVIYASGQFTPALNGKVNRLYESGRISASCIQAATDALAGISNVGDLTHFRRNNGRDGLVIGNHVFY